MGLLLSEHLWACAWWLSLWEILVCVLLFFCLSLQRFAVAVDAGEPSRVPESRRWAGRKVGETPSLPSRPVADVFSCTHVRSQAAVPFWGVCVLSDRQYVSCLREILLALRFNGKFFSVLLFTSRAGGSAAAFCAWGQPGIDVSPSSCREGNAASTWASVGVPAGRCPCPALCPGRPLASLPQRHAVSIGTVSGSGRRNLPTSHYFFKSIIVGKAKRQPR